MKPTIITILAALSLSVSAQKVQWISTVQGDGFRQEKSLDLQPDKSKKITVKVDVNAPMQTFEGFGGCFNEMGWVALNTLPADKKEAVYQSLFSKEGCNFNLCRMPIGANDFATSYYSHNDTPDDFEMINFNIDRDKNGLVPYIKGAQKVRPDLKIWASPWVPPVWMKYNNHYAGRPDAKHNGLDPRTQMLEGVTSIKMDQAYLKAYALYFEKFVKAYKAQGIDISAVHVQNEPMASQNFPSCTWRSEDMAHFTANFLGPQFEKAGLTTDIWFGTINCGDVNYFKGALNNEKAMKYFRGAGFQWAGKEAIAEVHKLYPNLKLWQTESECGDGTNKWEYAEYTWSLLKHYITNGVSAYVYWNMILDEKHTSPWNWSQNSLVTVNREKNEVIYNPEFYVMKHFSHLVQPGARVLKVSGNENMLAFRNPDGKLVVNISNPTAQPATVKVQVGDKAFTAQLKAHSFNSFVL